jgi:hypothetical protein
MQVCESIVWEIIVEGENTMKKFKKITAPIINLPDVHSMGVIGDPGCEGLGTYNMKVYAGALEESAKDDITLIVGDLVPTGSDRYYQAIQHRFVYGTV